jgi:hypothetical protein
MTTNLDPGKIAQLLTLSARQLDQSTLSALHSARQNALKRQAVRAPVFALATGRGTHSLIPDSIQQWVVAGLLIAMLIVGTSFWHHVVQEQQISDIDVAILTDDLPIEVFVD